MRLTRKRKATSILEASIVDIQAGLWKKSAMCIVPNRAVQNGTPIDDLGSDCVVDDKCGEEMGCALGLISMHGRHGRPLKNGFFEPFYPVDKESGDMISKTPQGVLEALEAVYAAIPPRSLTLEDISDFEGVARYEAMQENVIEYNDKKSTNCTRAEKWFRDAVDVAKQRERAVARGA
jgi:hypothetical protein